MLVAAGPLLIVVSTSKVPNISRPQPSGAQIIRPVPVSPGVADTGHPLSPAVVKR